MAHSEHNIIHIHPLAPAKPELGGVCNGCGVCCLVEPCPLGILLSRRRTGACDAVRWDSALGLYRCGAVAAPVDVLTHALPRGLRWAARPLAPVMRRLGLRWIAAGMGCDSSLEVAPSPSLTVATVSPLDGSTTMAAFHLSDTKPHAGAPPEHD